MLREDPPGRFDYLFEPLDVDESAGSGDDAVTQALEQPADENRWSRRIVLTGVVLASTAVAAATIVVLLQPTGLHSWYSLRATPPRRPRRCRR